MISGKDHVMKAMGSLILVGCAALAYGCASTVPSELVDARKAYVKASKGSAAELAPVELHEASEALARAEASFTDDAESYRTLDLAYVAERRSEMAEAQASIAMEQNSEARSDKDYEVIQGDYLAKTTRDLGEARTAMERSEEVAAKKLATEQEARRAAEKKASDAQAELTRLAAITDDARGTIITLSGSVLFRSTEARLMPGAESRLDLVIDALSATPDRNVVVEGYTDSQGSDEYNSALSLRRAEAVRDYLVHRGYPAGLVRVRGMGEGRPIADNDTAEGRANNRRVEIILERLTKQ